MHCESHFLETWVCYVDTTYQFFVQEVLLEEGHAMFWNLSIAVSAGTLPVNLTVKTLSCGIQATVLAKDNPGPEELLSKLFCLIFWLILSGFLELRSYTLLNLNFLGLKILI